MSRGMSLAVGTRFPIYTRGIFTGQGYLVISVAGWAGEEGEGLLEIFKTENLTIGIVSDAKFKGFFCLDQ